MFSKGLLYSFEQQRMSKSPRQFGLVQVIVAGVVMGSVRFAGASVVPIVLVIAWLLAFMTRVRY